MKTYVWLDGNKINGIYSRKFSDNQVELVLTDAQFAYLKENVLSAYYVDGKVVYKNLDKIKLKQELEKEQADILQWLSDNDWVVNKVFLGEWQNDDIRFLEYKKQRLIKRKRLDEINLALGE